MMLPNLCFKAYRKTFQKVKECVSGNVDHSSRSTLVRLNTEVAQEDS